MIHLHSPTTPWPRLHSPTSPWPRGCGLDGATRLALGVLAALALLSCAAGLGGCHAHGVYHGHVAYSYSTPHPHHWVYYDGVNAYFCGVHRHYWVHEGGRWVSRSHVDVGGSVGVALDVRFGRHEHPFWHHHPRSHPGARGHVRIRAR